MPQVDFRRSPSRVPGLLLPAALTVVVLVLDRVAGPDVQYLGALAAMPLVSASFVGPFATAGLGLVVLGGAAVFGHLEGEGGSLPTTPGSEQMVRLSFIAVATVLAAFASRNRTRRAERLGHVLSVADAAQRAILRVPPPRVGGVRCAMRYQSAAREARVGGDLVDVLDTPFGVRALVGDCRGSGLDAVRVAGTVLGSFRELGSTTPSLADVALGLDQAVRRGEDGKEHSEEFVTAALVQVDRTGRVDIVTCGHPPPYVLPPDGVEQTVRLRRTGLRRLDPRRRSRQVVEVTTATLDSDPPLGLLAGPPRVTTLPVSPGERLVLVTDGLLEARRSGRFLDAPRVLSSAFAGRDVEEALDQVVDRVRGWVRGRLDDDVALLVLEVPPGGLA